MKKDISTREDLLLLMTGFYKKLLADNSISYLFTDIARINLDHHLPVLVDFWDSVLFQSDTYRKKCDGSRISHCTNDLPWPHIILKTWLRYFKETVDELFTGDNSFIIKERAESIATVMQIRTRQQS